MSDKTRVLHITPHLNGGLGKVLLLQTKCTLTTHHVCLIERKASSYNFTEIEQTDKIFDLGNNIYEVLMSYDVVQVEYWNHPLIYDLLLRGTLDDVKLLVGCAHIQGNRAPQLIANSAIRYFDKMLITGKWLMKNICNEDILKKIEFIRYPIDSQLFSRTTPYIEQARKGRLTACYVGTVSYAKLSREFFSIIESCSSYLDFIIVGDPDNEILADSRARISNISFIGKTDDVTPYLENSDLFFYPLRKGHYGTGELALIEAMSFGLPTVAFDNESESSLIVNNQTGILCSNVSEFINALSNLTTNEALRARLGSKARKYIINNYSYAAFESFARSFYSNIQPTISRSKFPVFMRKQIESLSIGAKCFVQSLEGIDDTCHHVIPSMIRVMSGTDGDHDGKVVSSFFNYYPEYRYKSKGGLLHYLHCFPGDYSLNLLASYVSALRE